MVSSFLLGIFLLPFCAFFQQCNCWQEPHGLIQPSFFVHEHCLQRYRFPRLALFSKTKSDCQNLANTFLRKPALYCSSFNILSQKEWECIYTHVYFLTITVVMSEASFLDLPNHMYVSHVINRLNSTTKSGYDYFASILKY